MFEEEERLKLRLISFDLAKDLDLSSKSESFNHSSDKVTVESRSRGICRV